MMAALASQKPGLGNGGCGVDACDPAVDDAFVHGVGPGGVRVRGGGGVMMMQVGELEGESQYLIFGSFVEPGVVQRVDVEP